MKFSCEVGRLTAILMAAAAGSLISCGGDGDILAEKATVIDVDSVSKAIAMVGPLIPICSVNAAAPAPLQAAAAPNKSVWLVKKLVLDRNGSGDLGLIPRKIVLASATRPIDTLGSCGGRLTYPEYSHNNGVTTGTLSFDNFCTDNPDTGDRAVLNGNIAFVDTGTPSASGPITSRLEASSTSGITLTVQDSLGQPTDSELVTFSNFLYTVGVPGGVPTPSNPDRFTLGELKVANSVTGKTYRAANFAVGMFATDTGGAQFAVSGRGYRSNGEYFDVSTSMPVVIDALGDPTAGEITFSGASGSTAVATLVPGTVMQARMTVNGVPLAAAPCR